MKLVDLKQGQRVKLRNGTTFMVLENMNTKNYGFQKIAFVNMSGFIPGTDYDDEMKTLPNRGGEEFDIMSIHNIRDTKENNFLLNGSTLKLDVISKPIWERKECKCPNCGHTF